ncbi:MAG: GHKL domain-containing protein [Clostridia bacterium]|nr:GHKL domain-containing protein [Clostridia bacterium]
MDWYVILLIALLDVFLLVGLTVLVVTLYEKRSSRNQSRVFMKQVEEVHALYQEMRGWRHDYHNHLQLLKSYLAEGEYKKAEAYVEELEGNLRSVRLLSETGNFPVDGILNSKLTIALKKGIHIDYTLHVPKTISVSDLDLCTILGNLLDNAIESAECTKEPFLRLYLGIFQEQFYISCTNSTNEKIRKLDSDYVSKKRGNHGHGLKRIDLAVARNGGFVNRKNEPGVFATEILLPL